MFIHPPPGPRAAQTLLHREGHLGDTVNGGVEKPRMEGEARTGLQGDDLFPQAH